IRRYCDPQGLPMHAKFVVIDHGGARSAWFGSLNYNVTSRYLNTEILARSTDAAVVDDLEARFAEISAEAERNAGACDDRARTAADGR
ncbi:MAG TPA: phospholipase D-like domain-containing protein, partial [Phenylobacterium sp.]|nr:phospholipase D-like domain-containing protein [Phenylobacterium sp.]